MRDVRTILVSRKIILTVWESILAQRGIPMSPSCTPMTTKKHGEAGQSVCARAVPARAPFEFGTLKEGIAGSSVVPDRFEGAMERYSIGWALISILKNANKQSSALRKESGLRTWVAGFSTPRVYSIIGPM